ncbi:MAG: hypothetical protein AAGJ83_12975, partial [Planctomycetota bacterium]
IGEDMVSYIERLREGLRFLNEHCQFWTIETEHDSVEVVFLPRNETMPADPTLGLQHFVDSDCRDRPIVGTVTPDRRGDGYGLSRHDDNAILDFYRLNEESDIRFAHPRGFVAKSTSTDPGRLRELIELAMVQPSD